MDLEYFLGALITVGLIGYLFFALLWPERF